MIILSEKARTCIGIPSAENEQGDMTLRACHPATLLIYYSLLHLVDRILIDRDVKFYFVKNVRIIDFDIV